MITLKGKNRIPEVQDFLDTLISVTRLKYLLIVQSPDEYFSTGSTEVLFSHGVSSSTIKKCMKGANSLTMLLDCLSERLASNSQKLKMIWKHEEYIEHNKGVGILVMSRKKPLSNYEKLLIRNLIRLIVSLKMLHNKIINQKTVESFLNFLMLVAPIWNMELSMDRLTQLIAHVLHQSFGFTYISVKFKTEFESHGASVGKLPSRYQVINFLDLNDSGVINGNIDKYTWVIASEKSREGKTDIIFLIDGTVQNENLTIFRITASVVHMIFGTAIKSFKEKAALHKLSKNFEDTLSLIKGMVDMRDPHTENHSERVAAFAAKIAELMGLPADKIERIFIAGLLHDIGKIGVPEAILLKPVHLNRRERRIVEMHPVLGAQILQQYREFWDIIPWVKYHHERWDGLGYPEGLKGEKIPLEARILAVADAIETMSSDRIYRNALRISEIRQNLRQQAGKQWDPEIAMLAIKNLGEILLSPPVKTPGIYNDEVKRYRLESAYAWVHYSVAGKISSIVTTLQSEHDRLLTILRTIKNELNYKTLYLFSVDESCRISDWIRLGQDDLLPPIHAFKAKSNPSAELKKSIAEVLKQQKIRYYNIANIKINGRVKAVIFVTRENNEIPPQEISMIRMPLTLLLKICEQTAYTI